MKFNASATVTLSSTALAITILGVLATSANAFSFLLKQSSGDWQAGIFGADLTEREIEVRSISFPTVGLEKQIRWGTPGDAIDNNFQVTDQSGFGFLGAKSIVPHKVGEPFLLGTFRHYNNVIQGGTSIDFANLTIHVDLTIESELQNSIEIDQSFDFSLGIDETINNRGVDEFGNPIPLATRSSFHKWKEGVNCKYPSAVPCSDRVFVHHSISNQSFVIQGTQYTLEWFGLSRMPDIPTIIPGLTQENNAGLTPLYVFARVIDVDLDIPIAHNLTEDLTVDEGEWFNFSADATTSDGKSNLAFEWDLDNDGTYDDFTGPVGKWQFTENKTHTIGLRVSDGRGGSKFHSFEVNVENVMPSLLDFNLPATIAEGETVSISLSATDPGTDAISFLMNGETVGTDEQTEGNRSVQTDLGPLTESGEVSLQIKAVDGDGGESETVTRVLQVLNVAPTLTGFNLSNDVIFEGDSALASLLVTDPGADAVSFFLNGEAAGTDDRTAGIRSVETDLGVFEDEGEFTFTAHAVDGDGDRSQETLTRILQVLNVAPEITQLTENLTVREGENFDFAAEAFDPGILDLLSFAWDLDGDGVFDDLVNAEGTHAFTQEGTHAVGVQVSDGDGGIDTGAFEVTVENAAPTLLDFELSALTILEGQSASAFLSATDPGADAVSFFLNGDVAGTDSRTSGLRSLETNLGVFGDEGEFSFSAHAVDGDGDRSQETLTQMLTVLNVAPTITGITQDLTVFEEELFSVMAAAFDPGVDDLLSFEWDFNGDGLFDDLTGMNGTWSFSKEGTYQIGLRVGDGDGGFDTAFFNVTVEHVPEPASAWGILVFGVLGVGVLRRRKSQPIIGKGADLK